MQKYDCDISYKVSSDIGALKFMADPHVSPKDPYDAEFDGWIFPGQTIKCAPDEFKNACLIYAGNADATEFTVPPLSDFIKFSCGLTDDPLCRHVDFCKSCPSHSHAGELTADFSIKYDPDKNKDFKLYTNGNYDCPAINASGNKDI